MSRYTLSEAASADLIGIINASEERWGLTTARRTADRLVRAFEDITNGHRQGHRHRQLPESLSLLCVFERPFLIFFTEPERRIVRIVHGRRDVESVFSSDIND